MNFFLQTLIALLSLTLPVVGAGAAAESFDELFPEAEPIGEDWTYVEGFGEFWPEHFPWVFSRDHGGWWYLHGQAAGQFWAYDNELGWIWVSSDLYPELYSGTRGSWLRYTGRDHLRREVYDYWTETLEGSDWTLDQRLEVLSQRAIRLFDERLRQAVAVTPFDRFPDKTPLNGAYGLWNNEPASWWTCGFWPGLLWLMYEQTGEDYWKTQADLWTRAIEGQKTRTSTHDLGFMVGIPFMHAYRLTGENYYRDVAVTASASLATRFDTETVGAMRSWSWGIHGQGNNFSVIIDNMMNLEMLVWAAQQPDGQQWWTEASIQHSLTSERELVRGDDSTYHLVIFDERNGEVLSKGTHQGQSDSSTWSRGQGWAVYGFTTMYRDTGDERMLEAARRVADYFLDHMPSDWVPPYDFDYTGGIEAAPRDSSAGSLCASALFMLADLESDPDRAAHYRKAAKELLYAMIGTDYIARYIHSHAVLLEGSAAINQHEQGLIWGDYYLLEAILRYLGTLPPVELPE